MRRAALSLSVPVVLVLLASACTPEPLSVPRIAEADRVQQSPAAHEAELLAPQAVARANEQRAFAKTALKAGDDVAAVLFADRAIAAYDHAFILARLARATQQEEDARTALAESAQRAKELAASRAQIDAEGEELEKQLAVGREAQPVAGVSATNDPKREGARLVATRALAMEARLLCGSARLISNDDATLKGVDAAEKELADLDMQIAQKPHPAPIDAASRLRAKCLDRLTGARRVSKGPTDADALLAELSASGSFAPSRDERGVIVTLRDVFTDGALSAKSQAVVAELGRVAASHGDVGVQVVVNDATPPTKADETLDAQRADAIVKALVAAGATAAKVKGETAGVRSPIVDPGDAAHRARNARVDIVFVTR